MSIQQDLTALAYDKRGRLISMGKNSYTKTHPLMLEYGIKSGNPKKIYIHAEIDALLKAKARKRTVHKLIVLRYNRDGNPACSKPCETCMLAIKDWNVKHVEYFK